jgi:hypothetical protein
MSDGVLTVLIAGLLGMFGGVIGSVLTYKTQKPVAESNVNKVNTDANIALVGPLTIRLNELEREMSELREELRKRDAIIETQNDVIRDQNFGIGQLLNQLGNARMTPAWKPKDALATLPPTNKKQSGFGTR